MPAIGITGGISTGKSSFSDCLREILPGARFFNADEAVHAVVELPEIKQKLRTEFGSRVFSRGGDLNRAKPRAITFSDATRKCALERTLHPRIRRHCRTEAKSTRHS